MIHLFLAQTSHDVVLHTTKPATQDWYPFIFGQKIPIISAWALRCRAREQYRHLMRFDLIKETQYIYIYIYVNLHIDR